MLTFFNIKSHVKPKPDFRSPHPSALVPSSISTVHILTCETTELMARTFINNTRLRCP